MRLESVRCHSAAPPGYHRRQNDEFEVWMSEYDATFTSLLRSADVSFCPLTCLHLLRPETCCGLVFVVTTPSLLCDLLVYPPDIHESVETELTLV